MNFTMVCYESLVPNVGIRIEFFTASLGQADVSGCDLESQGWNCCLYLMTGSENTPVIPMTLYLRSHVPLLSSVPGVLMKRCFLTGASWVTGAFAKVQKAAADVNQRAKEKAATMESEEHRSGHDKVFSGEEYRSPYADSYSAPPYPASERAAVSLSSAADSASVRYPNLGYDHYSPLQSSEPPATKPPPAEGLIL